MTHHHVCEFMTIFLHISILNFICLFITQSFKLLTFFWNSSHLAHLCLMAVLYNVFRGLCHLTTYTFFQIAVNIRDNKITNGPVIVTYWENWPLIPTLCLSFLTKHLSMWEPPFLFLRVLILNLLGNTTCHAVSASLQQTIGSFNRNSKGYFFPLILAQSIACWLHEFSWMLMTMCAGHMQLGQEQDLARVVLKWLKSHRHLNWKLWNWTKLRVNFVTTKEQCVQSNR